MPKIAIISDLHAFDQTTGDPPSHFCARESPTVPERHPVAGLSKLIGDEQLSADILLCPGDLGDRADPVGIMVAWEALQQLKTELHAAASIATAGNHDLDSRFKDSPYDARGFLQGLRPRFPVEDEREFDRYWSRHYAVIQSGDVRIVTLNSCAYHGHTIDEIAHGRIAERTVDSLREHLESLEPKQYQILLCHHHPERHMELGLGEADTMLGGQLLLDMLGRGELGHWLVVHGHKHHPKLSYAGGSGDSAVVFSSASFSVTLYRELQTQARNQFHIIDLHDPSQHRLGVAGTVSSWVWASGTGWQGVTGGGLSPLTGFGYRGGIERIGKRVDEALTEPKKSWQDMVQAVPDLVYLIPQDFASLQRVLDKNHGIKIVVNEGMPSEIGRGS